MRGLLIGVAALFFSACASLSWKAPDKGKAIQADIEKLGEFVTVDVEAAMTRVKATLDSQDARWEENLRTGLFQSTSLSATEFDRFWRPLVERMPKAQDGDVAQTKARKAAFQHEIRRSLERLNVDSQLYRLATEHPKTCTLDSKACKDCNAARDARNDLLVRYLVRIKDYHEANFDDVFKNSAEIGLGLDVGTTIASALATAFTPVATKTAFAAAATILGGTKLAASKNVLNEKNSFSVLNAMITDRTESLAVVRRGMNQDIHAYPMQVALDDLTTYFHAGGLNKALAAMEAATARDKAAAQATLLTATLGGTAGTPAAVTVEVFFTDKSELKGLLSGPKPADGLTDPDKGVSLRLVDAVAKELATGLIEPGTPHKKTFTITGGATTIKTEAGAKLGFEVPDTCTGMIVTADGREPATVRRAEFTAEMIVLLTKSK